MTDEAQWYAVLTVDFNMPRLLARAEKDSRIAVGETVFGVCDSEDSGYGYDESFGCLCVVVGILELEDKDYNLIRLRRIWQAEEEA